MRRQRRTHQYNNDEMMDDYYPGMTKYEPLVDENEPSDWLQMGGLHRTQTQLNNRFESTIEAKVEVGDTLQALALKFHCTVSDIKRLNKIDKENEIHAHKVIKIPVTVHSVLLGTMPIVHKSGNNSPKHSSHVNGNDEVSSIMRNPLEDASISEKLMVASVNSAGTVSDSNDINNIILNAKVTGRTDIYSDEDQFSFPVSDNSNDSTSTLLSGIVDDEYIRQMRPIRGPSTFDWSGSDCDMSWVCLFIVILALCFVIPLIYVIYLAEHIQHNNSTLK